MAFEKEIKQQLKNKYHGTMGLRDAAYENVANILGATPNLTEDQIGNVVDGAEGFLKVIQSETDVVRKMKTEPKADPQTTKADPEPDDKIAAAIAKALEPYSKKIETLERTRANESNKARLISKLEEKKVDKGFYEPAIDGREFNTDEEIDAFAEKLATSYGSFNQSRTDKGLSGIPKPLLGGATDKGVSSGVQAYLDSKSGQDNKGSLGGKQL